MVLKSMFFKSILCTRRRIEFTKNIKKKNVKETMKFIRNSFVMYL